ncbi:hypothetical protein [Staphylococcus gallinarum]|uniref:hypothetical protein n=1 Tax=Staphylococcus gallinarum TaxID=1293 RepID=UPI001E4070BE|nr:hypothetical protein [Staphylococcus gallinarum]MCD8843595.1 hypothetical protein [Staphylococcus gallinarum]
MAHVYENHMGGVYFSKDYDESLLETCEHCFDSDFYLGFAYSLPQLKAMLREESYAEDYIKEICNEYIEFTEDKQND